MRSEVFPFIVWGSGGWTRVRFVCCVPAPSSRVVAGCAVNSVPLGSASRVRRVCGVGGAVPWGLLLGVSRVRRRAGLLVGVSRGWRRVLGIADQGLVAVLVLAAGVLASQNGPF